jgi:hypothetical protein
MLPSGLRVCRQNYSKEEYVWLALNHELENKNENNKDVGSFRKNYKNVHFP